MKNQKEINLVLITFSITMLIMTTISSFAIGNAINIDNEARIQIPNYGLGNIIELPIVQKNVKYEYDETIHRVDIKIVDERKILSYLSSNPEVRFKNLNQFNNVVFNHLTYYLTIHKLDVVVGHKGIINILGVEVKYKS